MAAKKAKKHSKPAKKPVRPAKKAAPKAKAKAKKVQPIPAGFHTVTPYLTVRGVKGLIEFVKAAFGAKLKMAHAMPDGTVMHAEVKIGDSIVMMGEARDKVLESMCYLYVKDTDKLYHQALKAGGTSIMEPVNQFYGDRNAAVKDAWGNQWWIGTHVEDVSPKEMNKRMAAQKPQ